MKKIMLFIGAFVVFLFVYVAVHTGVYLSLINFFGISSLVVERILAFSLVFLGVSFFVATFLAHSLDNSFTRGFYFFSATWLGLLVNLLVFFAIAFLLQISAQKLNFSVSGIILGSGAVVATCLFSIYGIWNAFNPIVKSVDVSIDNLPKEWVGKKIVQISDVHLGHIYRDDYMQKIAEKIETLKPNAIVITGDLFDGTDGNFQSFVYPLKKLKAPGGVYFAAGNHETYLGIEKSYDIIRQAGITVLSDSLKTVEGLQFIGIDYPLRGANRDIGKIIPAMNGYSKLIPSVLLVHEPVQTKAAKELGINLQLSGHTHSGQLFPFAFIPAIIYGGYDYGFKRDGSYAIYTSSGLGGWGPPMRTEKRSEIVEITLH